MLSSPSRSAPKILSSDVLTPFDLNQTPTIHAGLEKSYVNPDDRASLEELTSPENAYPAGHYPKPTDPAPRFHDYSKSATESSPSDAGFSATPVSPYDRAYKALEDAKTAGSGGVDLNSIKSSIIPKKPGDITYTSPYKEEELNPVSIITNKKAFDKAAGVDPEFYSKMRKEYDKDARLQDEQAVGDRFGAAARGFLKMAATPGSFLKGLTAGASEGLGALTEVNAKARENAAKIKTSQRLLDAQKQAAAEGDSKQAYEIGNTRDALNRQIALDQEKARASQGMELYKTDSSARDAELARLVAAAEGASSRANATQNAILGAQISLATSEANNERKDRADATRFKIAIEQGNVKQKQEYAKQYESAYKSISPGEIAKIFERQGRAPDPIAMENYRKEMAQASAARALGINQQPSLLDALSPSVNPASSFDD